ncbi:hypothetical protein [Actinoplanes utahensis]|uniref:hypothetical protein n=1 Tax=Actinoplanes utahensis TaxID=1869 RepID=UPI00068E70C7|nr:hypothetical protein [Actinoplanes utahensis]GIF32687.1 hypothetical protein Aut01nite_56730 [Actinoplanes utahensis]
MTPPEHSVNLTYALSDDGFGAPGERDAVRAHQARLADVIEAAGAGEVDGHEFGGGRVVIFAYGPDADRLFAAMEPHLRALPNRPAHAVLRYGDVDDPTATERRVEL